MNMPNTMIRKANSRRGAMRSDAAAGGPGIPDAAVVVLDIGLPGEDGISAARHLHELPNLTVIIVSARDAMDDRLAGLKAGADRYLVKPVNLAELVANIEAVGRRPARPAHSSATGQIQEERPTAGLWRLAKHDWRLTGPDGKVLNLTAREFLLLKCLFEANGETVSRKEVADKIIGPRVYNSGERLDVMLALQWTPPSRQ